MIHSKISNKTKSIKLWFNFLSRAARPRHFSCISFRKIHREVFLFLKKKQKLKSANELFLSHRCDPCEWNFWKKKILLAALFVYLLFGSYSNRVGYSVSHLEISPSHPPNKNANCCRYKAQMCRPTLKNPMVSKQENQQRVQYKKSQIKSLIYEWTVIPFTSIL